MTLAEFLEVTNEIESFYGTEGKPKTLNTAESNIWYEELKNLNQDRYREISREIFRTSQYMPKLAEVIRLNKLMPKEKVEKKEIEKEECHLCFGDGIFEVMYDQSGYIYSLPLKCICKNGEKYAELPSIKEYGLYKNNNGKVEFGNSQKFKFKSYVFARINNYLRSKEKC